MHCSGFRCDNKLIKHYEGPTFSSTGFSRWTRRIRYANDMSGSEREQHCAGHGGMLHHGYVTRIMCEGSNCDAMYLFCESSRFVNIVSPAGRSHTITDGRALGHSESTFECPAGEVSLPMICCHPRHPPRNPRRCCPSGADGGALLERQLQSGAPLLLGLPGAPRLARWAATQPGHVLY